ncbi:hypothetical protein CLOP_g656 [Closterium sp. NIES-67]|nr:hypothetical protein CLOP_g656 [Closterium sp. NIES-67]
MPVEQCELEVPGRQGVHPLQQRGACGARGVDEVQRGVKQRQARRQRHVQTQQAPPRQGLLEWHCHPAAAAAAAAAATGTTHTAAAAAPDAGGNGSVSSSIA